VPHLHKTALIPVKLLDMLDVASTPSSRVAPADPASVHAIAITALRGDRRARGGQEGDEEVSHVVWGRVTPPKET
jgi:hypothetical protein